MKDDFRSGFEVLKPIYFDGRYACEGDIDRLRVLRYNDLSEGLARQRVYEARNVFVPHSHGDGYK
jgi:hypothetical protein